MEYFFNYEKAKFENIPCAICKGTLFFTLATRSKNNLKARTVMCKQCGLIFISPRMSAKDYDDYYKYHYRKDRDAIKGSSNEEDLELNWKHAIEFGKGLAKTMGQFLKDGLTIDVGSSTGGVLAGLKELKPKLEILGIEPSLSESEYANSHGVKTITKIFEDYVKENQERKQERKEDAQNVFCVQSLNHLLDPAGFLEWSHEVLKEGGHIFLAVKNFKHQVRRAGSIEGGIQIDHVYMFTPETLKLLVESRGFKVVYLDVDEGKSKEEITEQRKIGLNKHHIRLVARKIPNPTRFDLVLQGRTLLKEKLSFSRFGIKLIYLLKYSRFSKFNPFKT